MTTEEGGVDPSRPRFTSLQVSRVRTMRVSSGTPDASCTNMVEMHALSQPREERSYLVLASLRPRHPSYRPLRMTHGRNSKAGLSREACDCCYIENQRTVSHSMAAELINITLVTVHVTSIKEYTCPYHRP